MPSRGPEWVLLRLRRTPSPMDETVVAACRSIMRPAVGAVRIWCTASEEQALTPVAPAPVALQPSGHRRVVHETVVPTPALSRIGMRPTRRTPRACKPRTEEEPLALVAPAPFRL